MRVTRLLALASLLCTLSVLAQDQPKTPAKGAVAPTAVPALAPSNITVAAESSTIEPWRASPEDATALNWPKFPLDQVQKGAQDQKLTRDEVDRFLFDPASGKAKIAGIDDLPSNDGDCLYIRSYVVARDSKDSDATHFVNYSTCQPTSRYGLKTTELKQHSPSH